MHACESQALLPFPGSLPLNSWPRPCPGSSLNPILLILQIYLQCTCKYNYKFSGHRGGENDMTGVRTQTAGAIFREAALQILVEWDKIWELVYRTPCQGPLCTGLFFSFISSSMLAMQDRISLMYLPMEAHLVAFPGNSIALQNLMNSNLGENFKQSAKQKNLCRLLF